MIAAYLTFFPVAINTLRGLHSTDRRDARADALVRGRVALACSGSSRVPASLPFIFSALKISATACVVGAIIGETPASIQDGLGGAIVNFNQYYSLDPRALWATNIICALLGIALLRRDRRWREKLVVRRAPEHVA